MTAVLDPHLIPLRSARRIQLSELTKRDRVVRGFLLVAAIIPTFALAFLAYQMLKSAYPAIVFNGWHFFTTKKFDLGNQYSSGVRGPPRLQGARPAPSTASCPCSSAPWCPRSSPSSWPSRSRSAGPSCWSRSCPAYCRDSGRLPGAPGRHPERHLRAVGRLRLRPPAVPHGLQVDRRPQHPVAAGAHRSRRGPAVCLDRARRHDHPDHRLHHPGAGPGGAGHLQGGGDRPRA